MVAFSPVPLPAGVTGIAAWVDSAAMTALLAGFGQRPLPTGPLAGRLAALEAISARIWDYRHGLERHETAGETFDEERTALIRAAAGALGLAARPPAHREYDHVLVLGGWVHTMMARAELAAAVLRDGVTAATVAGLGSVRELERQVDGLPVCPTEGDAVDLGLRHAFGLDRPTGIRSGVSDTGRPWWLRSYEDADPAVHVLAAPATRPGMRANTADSLVGWAEIVRPAPKGCRLLVVTTDIFVPFQHCDTIRLLGLPYDCTIDTIGVDTAANRWVPPHEPFAVLQEVRSAIRSMQALHLALG
jgi:hypothetical protein